MLDVDGDHDGNNDGLPDGLELLEGVEVIEGYMEGLGDMVGASSSAASSSALRNNLGRNTAWSVCLNNVIPKRENASSFFFCNNTFKQTTIVS